MKKITVSILTTLLMLSMVFSSSVFAAEKEVSAWESFLGLFSAKTAATTDVGVEYRGHIQNVGNYPLDGTWIQGPTRLGTVGQSLRLEGFWIQLTNKPADVNIEYEVHVQNVGWMAPVDNGDFAGTEGKSQQIEAIKIRLVKDNGDAVTDYSVNYRGHVQNIGDTAWYTDGQQLGTDGQFLRLEALEVEIVKNPADLTAYNAAKAAVTQADYTAASWTAYQAVVAANVVTTDNLQSEVDAATAAITAAQANLVLVPKVTSVTAVNVRTLQVTFNSAVSKDSFAAADFVVTNTATAAAIVVSDAQLSTDAKTATLLLASNVPATGVDVNIAEGALLNTKFDKFEKSSTKALKYAEDTVAPKLLSATFTGGANIDLTFDEPVDWATNAPVVSIDQVSVVTPSASTVAGKYVYTISAASALANGTHTVDVTNVTDYSGNKNVLITQDVVVKQDTSAATVSSIAANNSTSFIVTFSKEVQTLTSANFEMKKGNLVIDAANFTVTITPVDVNGTTTAFPSKYAKVNVADLGGTLNPLYGTNETAATLAVKVLGYKDVASVLGTEYNGSVTLTKDVAAPAITSEKLITSTATTIVIPYDKVVASTTANTITVKLDNVLVAQTPSVVGTDKNLTLTFGAGVLEAGKTYTISLAKGAVVGANTVQSVATTIAYTVPGTAISYTTTAPTPVVTKVNGQNILTLTYTGKVNDAAGLATAYKLNDAALPAGTNVYFTSSAKTGVVIELPASYQVNAENKAAKFTINGDTVQYDAAVAVVGGKYISGSTTTGTAYDVAITLKDNVVPTVTKAEYVKNAAGLATGIKITFSENIDDTTVDAANFVVTQGTTPVAYTVAAGAPATADLVDDNILNLTFTTNTTASGLVLNTNTDTTKLTLADLYTNLLGSIPATTVQ